MRIVRQCRDSPCSVSRGTKHFRREREEGRCCGGHDVTRVRQRAGRHAVIDTTCGMKHGCALAYLNPMVISLFVCSTRTLSEAAIS